MKRILVTIAVSMLAVSALAGTALVTRSHAPSAKHKTLTLADIELAASKTTVFLQIDGVTGPADDTDHSQHGAVQSFGFGISADTAWGAGGVSVAKPRYDDLTLTRPVDKFDPVLAHAISVGQGFAAGRVYIVATSKTPAITLVLDTPFITRIAISGTGGTTSEQLSLTAKTYRVVVDGVDSGPLLRP